MYPLLTCLTSLLCLSKRTFHFFYGPPVDESIDTATSYVRFCYDICCPVEKLFMYPHKISSPFLKRLRRKKEYYSRLNDFSNVRLVSSSIQAEIDRLSSIFNSRLSNCKPSQLWNNIRLLVLVPTKRNIPNINFDALNKSFIYGPIDTLVLLSPLSLTLPGLNPPPIRISCHSYPALNRILPRAPLEFHP